MLKDLLNENINTHLLYSDSSLVELKVYDTLKEVCEANLESIVTVENSSSFNNMLDLLNVQPFLAKKWLFIIRYKKVKKLLEKRKGIFSSGDTSCFLVTVESYKEFKEFQELVSVSTNKMYLAYISFKDVSWLCNGKDIKPELVTFIAKSYSRDPDKIMTLLKEIDNGLKVEKEKDIVAVCGDSSGSIVSFVLSLLSVNVKTERGKKISTARKMREALALSKVYGTSSMRNFILSTLKDMIYIKEMYLNGDIYNRISDVPECFNEKKLLKYKVYYNTILNTNLDDIMRLYVIVLRSGKWYRDADVASFVYDFYEIGVGV